MTDDYNTYAEKILTELGLKEIDPKSREELLETIRQRIEQKILYTVMSSLNKHSIAEVEEKIAAGGNEGEILQLMIARAPDLQAKVAEALAELYDSILTDTRRIMEAHP